MSFAAAEKIPWIDVDALDNESDIGSASSSASTSAPASSSTAAPGPTRLKCGHKSRRTTDCILAAELDETQVVPAAGPQLVQDRRVTRGMAHPPVSVPKTLKLGFLIGKRGDLDLGGETEELPSDAAVVDRIAKEFPFVDIVCCKLRSVDDIKKYESALQTCHLVHVLETEEYLDHHHYQNYRKMYQSLRQLGPKVVPSLSTLDFIFSKRNYMKLLADNGIAITPTHFFQRPTKPRDWGRELRAMFAWCGTNRFLRIITKPPHSGTRTDFNQWNVKLLATHEKSQEKLIKELHHIFINKQKLYLMVQPFELTLSKMEYRLFYFNKQFFACIQTNWARKAQRLGLKSTAMKDKDLLKVLVPVGDSVVKLLPEDSVMYRVDLYLRGPEQEVIVNEVELVDAYLLPEAQEYDIVEKLANAIVDYSEHHKSCPDDLDSSKLFDDPPLVPDVPNGIPIVQNACKGLKFNSLKRSRSKA